MKTILHLCADIGSDTAPYEDAGYNVIKVGKEIGVENFSPPKNVHGIIANPVCTNFSIAKNKNSSGEMDNDGLFLVRHCQRIIEEAKPVFWVIENPATGRLKKYLGKPTFSYEPWEFGSPWTKRTALWGKFNIPQKKYRKFEDVPEKCNFYIRPGRKPSLVWLHKNDVHKIPEFVRFAEKVDSDMSLRSLCSQKFATAFYEVNP